jgi:hypothetical protein
MMHIAKSSISPLFRVPATCLMFSAPVHADTGGCTGGLWQAVIDGSIDLMLRYRF